MLKLILSFILILVIPLSAISQSKGKEEPLAKGIEQERIKLKNAAFCNCLYKSVPSNSTQFTNEGSGSAYLELGAHSIDAYIKVMELASQKAKNKYNSKKNKSLIIMKCLDFYNSQELDTLVKGLDREIDYNKLKK